MYGRFGLRQLKFALHFGSKFKLETLERLPEVLRVILHLWHDPLDVLIDHLLAPVVVRHHIRGESDVFGLVDDEFGHLRLLRVEIVIEAAQLAELCR